MVGNKQQLRTLHFLFGTPFYNLFLRQLAEKLKLSFLALHYSQLGKHLLPIFEHFRNLHHSSIEKFIVD